MSSHIPIALYTTPCICLAHKSIACEYPTLYKFRGFESQKPTYLGGNINYVSNVGSLYSSSIVPSRLPQFLCRKMLRLPSLRQLVIRGLLLRLEEDVQAGLTLD